MFNVTIKITNNKYDNTSIIPAVDELPTIYTDYKQCQLTTLTMLDDIQIRNNTKNIC